jgi:hypothetical protein
LGRRTRAASISRHSPRARYAALRARWPAVRRGAQLGALSGLGIASLALLVGLARATLFLGTGGHLPGLSSADLRTLAVYVGMFVVSGAFVGVIHQVWANRLLTAVAFMLGGAVVMNAIAIADARPKYNSTAAIWMTGLGAAFGLAAAYGTSRKF